MAKSMLMQGNEACVRGAIAAGMRFFAGYPITPSTEIAEESARLLPQVGGVFIQMEDEISSMAAVIGASAAGVKAMTATSGPGFSLKQENIGYAAGAEIPCVIVDVQRSGPSTGLPTSPSQADVMQARWGTHGDHPIIALSPSSVSETYYLTARAFALSEKYRVPVIMLMDEIVGHLRENVTLAAPVIPTERAVPAEDDETWLPYKADPETGLVTLPPFGAGWRYHVTGLLHDERGYPTSDPVKSDALCRRLMTKLEKGAGEIIQYEEYMMEDAEAAVFCFGGTARSAMRAVRDARAAGVKLGMFRAITIWPFPDEAVSALSKRVGHIIVAEHNYGQLLHEVERCAQGRCDISFIGKVNGTVIMPDEITEKAKEVCGK